jgi:hypothetical protein
MEPRLNFNAKRAILKTGLLLALLFVPIVSLGQSNFDIQVERVITSLDVPPDTSGLATISYDPGAFDTYLSLGAQDLMGTAFNIIVSNRFLPTRKLSDTRQSISVPFDLKLLSQRAALFPIWLIVYIHLFYQPADYPFNPSTPLDTKTVQVTDLIDDARGSTPSALPPAPVSTPTVSGTKAGDSITEVVYRGCTVPNLDLNAALHPGTAAFAGDKNACVPTATANSLLWMDKEFGIFYGFPPDAHDLLDSLSRYMKRALEKGTPTDNMIRGKLDFINAKKLPLAVRFQVDKTYIDSNIVSTDGKTVAKCSNTSGYPTWEFLKEAMKESCDVEINYEAVDAEGHGYAHSVVVTGIEDYKRSGLRYLDFKHDRRQAAEGGTRQEAVQVWSDPDGRLRISGRRNAFIRDVVAECPRAPYKTAVEDRKPAGPTGFELLANYPNPFNAATVVPFRLGESSDVSLTIRDAGGRVVTVRELGRLPAGENRTTWQAEAEPSGVYVISLRSGSKVMSRKVALIR